MLSNFNNENDNTFTQTVSFVSIEKVLTDGLVDTYEIKYSDGKSSSFSVTNGKGGIDGSNGTSGTNGKEKNTTNMIQKLSPIFA